MPHIFHERKIAVALYSIDLIFFFFFASHSLKTWNDRYIADCVEKCSKNDKRTFRHGICSSFPLFTLKARLKKKKKKILKTILIIPNGLISLVIVSISLRIISICRVGHYGWYASICRWIVIVRVTWKR